MRGDAWQTISETNRSIKQTLRWRTHELHFGSNLRVRIFLEEIVLIRCVVGRDLEQPLAVLVLHGPLERVAQLLNVIRFASLCIDLHLNLMLVLSQVLLEYQFGSNSLVPEVKIIGKVPYVDPTYDRSSC